MNRSGNRITDAYGRTLILRGVNLGGSSKLPFTESGTAMANPQGDPAGPGPETRRVDDTRFPAAISFVGRPFPLEEADEHFENLKNWGFTFVRFIITWEALEHLGPGLYDEAYLAYLSGVLRAAEKKGISVFMDPHQDVWSRWTGGDGAPAWTLEKLGIDLDKLDAVGAVVNLKTFHKKEVFRKKTMIWPVNYSLYAAATMFTLFFAGNAFAPGVKIEGETVQDFLQERYIAAFRHCYRRLKNCKAIAGWGVMNEPHPGFIGYNNLQNLENVTLALGQIPSPFQAMIAASGQSVKVPVYTPWFGGWKVTDWKTINPRGLNLFREGFTCPWKQAGVWAGEGEDANLLLPDHFSKYRGRPVRFTDDFLKPFTLRFIERMKEAERPLLFFIEGVPHGENPSWGREDPQNTVNAFHHYDGFTLFSKSFRPWLTVDPKTGRIILGKKKTAAHYSEKLAAARAWARDNMGDMPCFLGEFGLPFDMNNKRAYKTGDYSLHEKALSLYYDAIDENLLGSTIWNYTADNNHKDGDQWNGEDLSIISNGEPRAEGGWLRPYPMATAGIPLKFTWDREKAALYFRFRSDPHIEAPTEIFLPSRWFGENPPVLVKKIEGSGDLRAEYRREEQRLFIYNDGYAGEAEIEINIMRAD